MSGTTSQRAESLGAEQPEETRIQGPAMGQSCVMCVC